MIHVIKKPKNMSCRPVTKSFLQLATQCTTLFFEMLHCRIIVSRSNDEIKVKKRFTDVNWQHITPFLHYKTGVWQEIKFLSANT